MGGTRTYGAGTITGNLSETRGAVMCVKWVIFGGFGRENGGEKGAFGASKAEKRRLFCVPEA